VNAQAQHLFEIEVRKAGIPPLFTNSGVMWWIFIATASSASK